MDKIYKKIQHVNLSFFPSSFTKLIVESDSYQKYFVFTFVPQAIFILLKLTMIYIKKQISIKVDLDNTPDTVLLGKRTGQCWYWTRERRQTTVSTMDSVMNTTSTRPVSSRPHILYSCQLVRKLISFKC